MSNNKPPDKGHKGPATSLLVGVVALIIGGIGLYSLLNGGDDEESGDEAQTTVLVATQDLAVGTDGQAIIEEGLIEIQTVNASSVAPNTLTSPAQLSGQILAVPKQQGDSFTVLDLAIANAANVIEVPPGMEAVAVTLPFDPAVAGYVRAGDFVTVYSVLDTNRVTGETIIGNEVDVSLFEDNENVGPVVQTLLRDVMILDVSNDVAPRYGTQAEARAIVPQVTYLLAVEPEDAARIIYTMVNEQVYLALVDDENAPDDQVRIDYADIGADPRTAAQLAATDEGVDPVESGSDDSDAGTGPESDDSSAPTGEGAEAAEEESNQ